MIDVNNKAKILLADDDEELCSVLNDELSADGFLVKEVYDGSDAIEALSESFYDLILLDIMMKEVSGVEVLRFVKENYPATEVVILTGKAEIGIAVECTRLGAYDFLTKPYDYDKLVVTIDRALQHKNLVIENRILSSKITELRPGRIIGNSDVILKTLSLAKKAAESESGILIQGETGTGKELFAEYIHNNSGRSSKPFVAINCASLSDQLIESELFGHEKGAFTDAKSAKQGLVEVANNGTLFLDEIGELSLAIQPKLLRFLESGEYRRVGGVRNLRSNVRVIGATNKDLMKESEGGAFRKDLLFRLNVITLTLPPLRERKNDIIQLAKHFLKIKSPVKSPRVLAPETEKKLLRYPFPGNVRELQHIIERAVVFSTGNIIHHYDLNLPQSDTEKIDEKPAAPAEQLFEIRTIEDMELELIKRTLDYYEWNRENSSRALGISQKTLYSKIKKYNLD